MEVSLNKGLASVKLKPGNTLTMQQFWQAVKRNGFTPKESSGVLQTVCLLFSALCARMTLARIS